MDLDKNVEIVKLYEVYGAGLTDRQKQIVELYVLNDLSLKEVSEILGITRQAVKYAMDNIYASLTKQENDLKFIKKLEDLKFKLIKLKNSTIDKKMVNTLEKIIEEI